MGLRRNGFEGRNTASTVLQTFGTGYKKLGTGYKKLEFNCSSS